jgi:DNA gyrase subunit A
LNIVQIPRGDSITAYVPVRNFVDGQYLVLATEKGVIKKTPLPAYGNPRRVGIQAIVLREDDKLIAAELTDGEREIVLATRRGQAIRFNESRVRAMGRVASGVRGVRLKGADDAVIGMVVIRDPGVTLLTVSERGYGKRSRIEDYRLTDRGGQGVRNIVISERNGLVVGIQAVRDKDELMLISQGGQVIRLRIHQVSLQGRATQGVRLIQLAGNERVMGIAKIAANGEMDSAEKNGLPTTTGPTAEPPTEETAQDEEVTPDETAPTEDETEDEPDDSTEEQDVE